MIRSFLLLGLGLAALAAPALSTAVCTKSDGNYTATLKTDAISANFIITKVSATEVTTGLQAGSGLQLRWHTDNTPNMFTALGASHVFGPGGDAQWQHVNINNFFCDALSKYSAN